MFFEFADAEVAQVTWEAGVLSLRFSAAAVMLKPDAELQWSPLLVLAVPRQQGLPAVQAFLEDGIWAGRLKEGAWRPEVRSRQRLLPLPWTNSEPGVLELEWAQGQRLELPLQSLTLQLPDGAQSVQAWQC